MLRAHAHAKSESEENSEEKSHCCETSSSSRKKGSVVVHLLPYCGHAQYPLLESHMQRDAAPQSQ